MIEYKVPLSILIKLMLILAAISNIVIIVTLVHLVWFA